VNTVSPSISQEEVVDPGGRGQFPMIWSEETLIPMLPPSTPKKEFMVVMCMCAYGITVQTYNALIAFPSKSGSDESSDGVKTFFSNTEALAKTDVSRYETSRDISDLAETRRDLRHSEKCLRIDTLPRYRCQDMRRAETI